MPKGCGIAGQIWTIKNKCTCWKPTGPEGIEWNPDDQGHECHPGLTDSRCNLPAALSRENQSSRMESGFTISVCCPPECVQMSHRPRFVDPSSFDDNLT